MPVTVMYQGVPLTFPDLNSPDEAYSRLGVSPSKPAPDPDDLEGSSNSAPIDVNHLQPLNNAGVDPKDLSANKDWLGASRILYNSTQGHQFQGSDDELATWGLDRMARFNYNLPLMGVDAWSIRSASPDQKRAFLYLLNNFDHVNSSWAGFGRAAKYAAMDPTMIVNVGSLGLDTAFVEGAKFTTKAGLKAALKLGLVDYAEGALLAGASERVQQQARINADDEAQNGTVDWQRIAESSAMGGLVNAGIGVGLAAGWNHLFRRPAPGALERAAGAAPVSPAPDSPTIYRTQGELPLGDMNDDFQALQTRLDRQTNPGIPDTSYQGQLPLNENIPSIPPAPDFEPPIYRARSEPGGVRFRDAPGRGSYEHVPWADLSADTAQDLFQRDLAPVERLGEDWGTTWNVRQTNEDFPNLQANYEVTPGQRIRENPQQELPLAGRFENWGNPHQTEMFTREEMAQASADAARDSITNAARQRRATAAPDGTNSIWDRLPRPGPDEKIGGANGPSLLDLKRLLQDVGHSIRGDAVRGWNALTDVSNPLTRALYHLTPQDAKSIAREFGRNAMTQDEFKGFTNATINSQNTVAAHIKDLLNARDLASGEDKAAIEDQIVTAEKIMNPLKLLAKEAGTTSGSTLVQHRANLFKGLERDRNLDTVLSDLGLDRLTATNAEKSDALQEWFNSIGAKEERLKTLDRLVQLRRDIDDAIGRPYDAVDAMNQYASALAEARQQAFNDLGPGGKMGALAQQYTREASHFFMHTVLSPSSVTVNTLTNAFQVFAHPMLRYLNESGEGAFKKMVSTYGTMFGVSRSAFRMARLAWDLEGSVLDGENPRWMEQSLKRMQEDAGGNLMLKFAGRNLVRVWTRMLGATDEFFNTIAYHSFVTSDAVADAMISANKRGLGADETRALVKDVIKNRLDRAVTYDPNPTAISKVRNLGISTGYSGDGLKLFVQNYIDKNPDVFARATNKAGIDYSEDLMFKREFSGGNAASSIAKSYEQIVMANPAIRMMFQLFFRTPVRVLEAGMRLTPVVQFLPIGRFWDDVAAKNGYIRQLRTQGEVMFALGAATSAITAYATGDLTGSGADYTPQEKEKLVAAGWRPYSIKVGDQWLNYRNFDPVATPVKIMANAMERLQKLNMRQAQGELDQKTSMENVLASIGVATGSVLQALQDANLTQGVSELTTFFESLSDPERKENAFTAFAKQKAQLLVPNAIRSGVRRFGEGQNVATDPHTADQIFDSIINPASERVPDKYDALGNKMSYGTQGFFPYIGLDAAGRDARSRGLSERDQRTLNEIAKITLATGKTFNPTSKIGNIDMRTQNTADGSMSLYNRVMQDFNKSMPDVAAAYLDKAGPLPTGRRGLTGPKADAFERLHNQIWRASMFNVAKTEPAILQAIRDQAGLKADVFQGNRDSTPQVPALQ